MGWASSATGGGYGGGGGGGNDNDNDNDANGGYGSGGFGGEVDGGGVSSGSGSSGGGYSSGFGSQVDTGGVAGSGGTSRGSTRADRADRTADLGVTGGVSQSGIDAATSVAGMAGGVTGGSVADMADVAERSFATTMPNTQRALNSLAPTAPASPRGGTTTPGTAGYGVTKDSSAIGVASNALGTSMADLDDRVGVVSDRNFNNALEGAMNQEANDEAGSWGRSIGSFLGPVGSVLGSGIDAVRAGYNASEAKASVNDQLGTSMDASLASNIGRQAAANTVGTVASVALGPLGGRVGSAFGETGAMVGGMLASNAGGDLAADAVLGSSQTSTPGSGTGADGTRGLLASGMQIGDTTGSIARAEYGPVDFDGYASYAESFFA